MVVWQVLPENHESLVQIQYQKAMLQMLLEDNETAKGIETDVSEAD